MRTAGFLDQLPRVLDTALLDSVEPLAAGQLGHVKETGGGPAPRQLAAQAGLRIEGGAQGAQG